MKLIYRGVEYQHELTTVKTVLTQETAVYRGVTYHRRKVESSPTTVGFAALTYRRAQYRSLRYSPFGSAAIL